MPVQAPKNKLPLPIFIKIFFMQEKADIKASFSYSPNGLVKIYPVTGFQQT
jgi:hypothetical protein